jgi:hypothetical protein
MLSGSILWNCRMSQVGDKQSSTSRGQRKRKKRFVVTLEPSHLMQSETEAERFFSPAATKSKKFCPCGERSIHSITTTKHIVLYSQPTQDIMAITKRPRDDAPADRAAKKHRKGFTVGPQNLPDGTHRRKSTRAHLRLRLPTLTIPSQPYKSSAT